MKKRTCSAAAGMILLAAALVSGSGFAEEETCPDSATGYHVSVEVTEEATCTTNERIYHVCQEYGVQLDEEKEIPNTMTGHTYDEDGWGYDEDEGYPEPACTEPGKAFRECTECGEIQTKTEPALGHTFARKDTEADEIRWENCNDEYHCPVCEECGAKGAGQEHQWDEGEVTEPATPEEEGVFTYTCTVCGGEKTEAIPKMVFGAPKKVTAEAGSTSVSLSWSPVSGMDGYEVGYVVYRKDAVQKKQVALTETKKRSFVDKSVTAGTGYTYTVQAFLKSEDDDGEIYYSRDFSGDTVVITTVGQVTKLKGAVTMAVLDNSTITLNWDPVAGATGYVVEGRGKGNYQTIATVKGDTKTTCTVSKVDFSKTTQYQYRVRAYTSYGGKKAEGKYSQSVTVKKPAGLEEKEGQVTGLKITRTARNSVSLQWNKYPKASGYMMYRCDANSGKLKAIADVKTNKFTDRTVAASKGYTYVVKAYKQKLPGIKLVYSEASAQVHGITTVQTVGKVTAKKTTKSSASTKATLSWKKLANVTEYVIYQKAGNGKWMVAGKIEGGYQYRYDGKKSRFVKEGKAAVSGSTISFRLTGLNLKTNAKYQYRVAAATSYKGLRSEGARSKEALIKK